jgi:RNA polymerase sigma factor (sigma-70 family)
LAQLAPDEVADLVAEAAAGSESAWERLVDAYVGMIWATVRRHHLPEAEATDVVQTTWLRLVQNIDRLSDPSRVGAWLATTARRECLRIIAQKKRTIPTDDPATLDRIDTAIRPSDSRLLDVERDEAVRGLFLQLPPRCQELLSLLLADPAPSYAEISEQLGIPQGSIGPTRGRCLKKLEQLAAQQGIELSLGSLF